MASNNIEQTHFESHLLISDDGITAITHLKDNTHLSKQVIKKVMNNGAVWLESPLGIHRLRRAKKVLSSGSTLHFYYDETIQNSKSETAALIADEGEYSIWNKPYGMYSQGSKWGDHCSIYRYAEQHLKPQRPAFLVHRLDRAASGLIILAHSKKMATEFSELFKNRQIKKQYNAIISGKIENKTIPFSINNTIDGKSAVTHIIHQHHNNNHSSNLTIEIETGRKHQIRQHLAEINHAILGDRLYGKEPYDCDLQLRACLLEFTCPVSQVLKSYKLDEISEQISRNTSIETTL